MLDADHLELSVAPDIAVPLRGGEAAPGPDRTATTSTRRPATADDPGDDSRAPRPATDRRPGVRAPDPDRLAARLIAVEATLERERERRAEAETALEAGRAELRRTAAELGRVAAELELAHAAREGARETAAELDAARRDNHALRTRYDALVAEHDRALRERRELRDTVASRAQELQGAQAELDAERTRAREAERTRPRDAEPARTRDAEHERARGASRAAEREPVSPTPAPRVDHTPPVPRTERPVNPSLRPDSPRWFLRGLAVLVLIAVLVAVWVLLHATVLHR